MKKLFILLVFCFCFTSCQLRNGIKDFEQAENKCENNDGLKSVRVVSFFGIDPQIIGCECYDGAFYKISNKSK